MGTGSSHGGNILFLRRELFVRFVLSLTLLVAGIMETWADDLSGTYYLAFPGKVSIPSDGYNPATPASNYYLCPTEGYLYYQATDQCTKTDNGQPFLTTYKCKDGVYDADKAVWTLIKHTVNGQDYYYVKHVIDNKYLIYNGTIAGNRLRAHLEDTESPGTNALFKITADGTYSGYYYFAPYGVSKYWLNLTEGNYNSLVGQPGKNDGPTIDGVRQNVNGTLGGWTEANNTSQIYLEDVLVPSPTITINGDDKIEITTTEGYPIYYTTDGSTPTTSSDLYSGAITITESITAVKAIAVRTIGSFPLLSNVAVLPINYTYHIVNQQNKVALTKTVRQAVGTALSGYSSIPEDIRSSYISDETVTFYSFEGTYAMGSTIPQNTFDLSDPISATPTENTNIYVRYSTGKLDSKYLHLEGTRPLNVRYNNDGYKFLYEDNGTLAYNSSEVAQITTNSHLWYIGSSTSDGDPYDVLVKNSDKTKYLAPTPSLDVSATTYFIASNDRQANYDEITLKSLTGGSTLTVRVNEVEIPTSYHLIDKSGKDLSGPIESTSSKLELPDSWKSPLVTKYHFWRESAFNITNGTYELLTEIKDSETGEVTQAAPTEIESLTELGSNEQIYVTYDVDPTFVFDTTDDDATGTQAYRLEFTGGETFNQENGKDAVMTTAQKAVFPYSNGDACLYVYGTEQWNTQLASGASTRTRWLWYVVSPNSDPYHVFIMSHQGQASSHNYFRTYSVEYGGSTHIVTGVTTKNPDASGEAPTQYMILKQGSNCKLVTIEGHHVVNSFEQYWKNNPTVQNLIDPKVTALETYADDITLTASQTDDLPSNWHTYQAFANAAPWVGWKTDNTGTGKQYKQKSRWFQTIDMGSTGEFIFQPTILQPQVILLDQHGWEIMRTPLTDTEKLRMYDSPMVEEYHWYPTASKVPGYHKYSFVNQAGEAISQAITVYDQNRKATSDTYTHNSTTLTDNPYPHIDSEFQKQDDRVKSDFYVTYTVKAQYANAYAGAATFGETSASKYVVKQGDAYAKIAGNALTTATGEVDVETVSEDMQWYLRPNFYIDAEMGYNYEGQYDEKTQGDTEEDNFDAGKNGFDPYNLQIQSVANTARYFKTNSTGMKLANGAWEGATTSLSLQSPDYNQVTADGNDQTTVHITNTTFMAVGTDAEHISLMPRFDNTKVVNSLTGTQFTTPADATGYFSIKMVATVVTSSDQIRSMGGYYVLAENFSMGTNSVGTTTTPFKGTIDGKLRKLTSTFDKPFIAYADGATIKNVIIENAGISSGNNDGHAGAIVGSAKGETYIYNCGVNGGEISGTNFTGGIVGLLDDYSRVINCYSYAKITGGTDVGGIVGHNDYLSTASDLRTMVMNCAFYGDITGDSNASPVYGGYNIANTSGGLNNYNYYSYNQAETFGARAEGNTKIYNTTLAVADEDFKRFEFYRLLLNSNRRLAAYYITGKTTDADIMAKWVLETADRSINDPKPYPVLKAQDYYPSIINIDAENAPDSISVGRNHGGKLEKTLSVTISGVGTNAPTGASITDGSLTLTRTDKDFDRYNFNYDKVQLPYYNDVGTGNYTSNKVVTGWEIISMSPTPSTDPYTSGNYPDTGVKDYPDFNFADRKSVNKDLYSVSKRIFSQGAYFDVPYGVTSITIQPHWATAAYVADEYLDVVYTSDYDIHPVTELGNSFKQFPTGKITLNGSEQTVHKTIDSAIGTFTKGSVYDYAVVLVGNLHKNDVPLKTDAKRFTMMSVDQDNDHEPDYSMIYHHTNRTSVCPIRFDFLNVIGTAFAQKPNGATLLKNTTIFRTRGWFEVTNTALLYSNQMEYENLTDNTKEDAPLILLGGKFDQFVSTQRSAVNGKTIYIHVGGNVWIDQFGLGTHSDGSTSTPHVPVSVTGGEYKGFYLTGTYNQKAAVRTDNAECYISGGHFVEAAGACQEAINGDVRWQIYNADIDAFYGGGINNAKPIAGHVTTEIFNSYVTTFCGGPKFGDMQTGKDVRTTATGCVFEKYFGAGYGGTSYSRVKYHDAVNYNFTNLAKYYSPNDRGKYFDGQTTNSRDGGTGNDQYGKKGVGVATDFDYEFFVWSSGQTGARFFVKFASFSLANCINVYSTLNKCTVNQNFYGGGSFGSVSGTANSVLNDCTVHGNVFGGGYSAMREKVPVRDAGFTKIPKFNSNTGMFEAGTFSGTTEYEWKEHALPANGNKAIEDSGDKHYIYTDVDLDALGKVGNTVLTIQGNTVVEGNIFQYDDNGKVVKDGSGNNVIMETTGGVFGGGDESAVNQNTQVTVEATGTDGVLNVFGGGNTADVIGDAEVTMTSGKVVHDVFGGGKGSTTVVGGNVTVNIGTKDGSTYTGGGTVNGNVYGGSALGAVNAKKENSSTVYSGTDDAPKLTTVNIYAGTVAGSVFGGGLGQQAKSAVGEEGEEGYIPAVPAIAAQNFGPTTVTIENSDNTKAVVNTAVYGGSNENGVLKRSATVTMIGGTVGTSGGDIKNVVFGGGFGEPTLVEGDVEVNIGTSSQTTGGAAIHGNVYGGGALGNVNTSKPSSALVFNSTKKTDVNLLKGTITGNVFGGGLGRKAAEGVLPVEAYVGGDVYVTLDGAKLSTTDGTGQIFGANNLNGTPKGGVTVHVKRTVNVDSEKDELKTHSETPRDERTTYDVAAVYGGGNQADYIPTNATLTLDTEAEGYDAGNPAKVEAACAKVIIDGCDQTSIEYVYGGGNAAAVPATDVTILGTYIIKYVFGGGNGKGSGNPGANVGTYYNGAREYGSGKAVTKLVGGHIINVFGGSDTKGNVRGGTSITMPDASDYPDPDYHCCEVRDVKQIYGAGNEAEQDGNVTLILGCVDNMDYVYGGARNAHVKGGVDLVVTSGHYLGVFGGNDLSGTIQGPITVTIEETGCKPLEIDNLYLGGNKAPYSVYGYKEVTDSETGKTSLVARSSMTDGTAVNPPASSESETQLYHDPVLNIVSCTSIGNAFGGGYGTGAVMYGNPTVKVNMIPGDYAKKIDRDGDSNEDNDATALGTIGNVYGGGEEANVIGNTAVEICTAETVTVRSHKGAPVTNEPTAVQGALITGNVFGAGKGVDSNVESAMVTGNTTITMAKGSVAKSVYGGGELSQVGGSTTININGGTIGTTDEGGAIYGNIYGGGLGNVADVDFGLVKGNANVNISGGSVYHNIYGGGAYGSVGTFTYDTDGSNAIPDGTPISCAANTGTANITITGGTIGTDGHENGMVFGSSRGDVGAPGSINDYLAWVDFANVVIGTTNDATDGPQIKGSLYGSGENGHTLHNASVTIHSGMVGITETMASDPEGQGGAKYPYRGNVYGGGCGTDKYDNNTKYNPLSGIVHGTATVIINGGHVVRNLYGAGAMGSVDGLTTVTINGGTIGAENSGGGYVYAAARGDDTLDDAHQAYAGSTELNINGGTVWGDAFGGGQAGIAKGAVTVNLTGGEVKQDVYGGGALAKTNTVAISEGVYPATNVTLAGTTIAGNLYGGGLGRLGVAAVLYTAEDDEVIAETKNVGDEKTPAVPAVEADVKGSVTVRMTGGEVANVFGCNNINGAPQSTVEVNISGGKITNNVYGGGNQAKYSYTDADHPLEVNISGGVVNNDVFGGGLSADVAGSINVSVSGGKIANNVYGGGALANTNTANWNGDGSIHYVLLTVKADPTAEELAAGILKTDVTPVAGYFTEAAGVYTRITNPEAKASGATSYYKKAVTGTWADGKTSASNTTTVSLTGGLVGNVYGGGLGNSTTMANVYGDVTVNVNKDVTDPAKGVVFNQQVEHPVIGGTDYPTPIMGRVFGCNNYNGTPTGEVTVHVYSTRQIRKNTEGEILPGHGSGDRKFSYEIQAVYGGGNQADYLPAAGKKSHVIIEGCDETSIEKVYGGCNSAVIPETDVLINGCYDIGYGFGGGNGGRPIKKEDGNWYENEGAIVIGTARIECQGGKIGQVFGGGDSKGSCGSTAPVIPEQGTGTCPLWITRLYGAGNAGDVSHVNIILSACSGNAIEYVHGGSYNAHVHGNINLTITSGILKNVYGGNDSEGGIEGDITVNIEETDGCNPIIIQNLVGGGNEAAYPGTLKSGSVETPINRHGKITVNVKSATRIDNVYGGSFNAEADADTEININMMKGNKAGETVDIPKEFSYIPNISGITNNPDGKTIHCTIDDAIGTIGNVFGGGKQGIVKGNTKVNINSSAKVYIMKRNDSGQVLDTSGNPITTTSGQNIPAGITIDCTDEHDTQGAHITGDVFGGGENADVTSNETNGKIGNAEVYICANKTGEGTYASVAEGAGKVTISNGSVYGGGNEGDILGNTTVTMSGGYVFDGVYGGGLHGSVGTVMSRAALPSDHPTHDGCLGGKPDTFKAGTGKCTVVISGGQVGPNEAAASDGGMMNTHKNDDGSIGYFKEKGDDPGPVDVGFVFGAGRGDVENPAEIYDADFHTYVKETDVTISGGLIMASVYGGGENGRVRGDTHVTISGGQIGCGMLDGSGNPVIYDDDDFINPATASAPTIETKAGDMPECSYWTYGEDTDGDGIKDEFVPFDPYADDFPGKYGKASTETPTDGKTYYGSVFGGGSGYFPYEIKNSEGTVVNYEWLRSAGWVEGNTVVDITGGHILNNIYGGNEYTDVGTAGNASTGKCTVNFGGKATLGVPRTLAEIAAHPVSCYLFGAGKGDQRTHFNTWTNVNSVEVNVTGGIIYGSVFGGGEDGHVIGDTKVTISGGTIGTWGTSYVDGNVFGGGRGFTGEALTAGNVGGSVDLDITGGTILGSIYGGGRLGSVGYGLYASTETGKYGVLQDDGKFDDGTDGSSFYTHGRGNIDISITGGTIGNAYEYKYYEIKVDKSGKTTAQIAAARTSALETQKATDYIPYTDFELADSAQVGETTTWKYIYRLKHTKGGNVFAGGMGRLYKLDGKTPQNGWKELGKVKKTTLTISGADTEIKGNVYGGGELGFVSEIHENVNNTNVLTDITITNGTIGTVVKDDSDNDKYTFGSVYGGGYGSTLEKIDPTKEDIPLNDIDNPKFISGRVHGSTRIRMEDGTVLASIYGGGEVANVRGSSNIAISGGTVGKDKVGASAPYTYFGGATMGNVYGGGNGNRSIVRCGQVFGNATISISQAEGKTTRIYHNVYGGGAYGSVGDIDWIEEKDPIFNSYKVKDVNGIKTEGTGKATIIITGGTIGVDGKENGMVFGSSRGDVIDPGQREDLMAFTYDTDVTIGTSGSGTTLTTPLIKGSVYGSGENGHVWHNTDVKVHSGTIGVPTEYYAYRGNVYGAGCGTDQYDSDGDGTLDAYRKTAGIVRGDTKITIDGGQVARNVYGAGAMGSVLGNTSVTVTGNAVIGDNLNNGTNDGNVYGAARGEVGFTNALATFADFAYVSNSSVTISGGTVRSSVYGGGEAGIVKGNVTVTMTGGTVAQNVYGGGALADSNTSNVSSDGIGATNVNTTTVNLKGGTIAHDAFGGALGRVGDNPIEPKVYGNITVELNKDVATTAKGCILERIFGCNDLNGTPKGHVKVHVHATQNSSASKTAINQKFDKRPTNVKTGNVLKDKLQEYINATKSGEGYVDSKIDGTVITAAQTTCSNASATDAQLNTAISNVLEELCKLYDVKAVYGGGNLAPYMPRGQEPKAGDDDWKNTLETTEVIIEGCDLTSIRQVYAGGNAASTPATNVQVNSAYEIDELFGGGNGNDAYEKAGKWYVNPGANVGYTNYISHSTNTVGKDGSTKEKAYPIGNEEETLTKTEKQAFRYGRGYAVTNASGGRIHAVYGGSNQRGNISTMAMSAYQSSSSCTLNTDETYGAGKNAKLDGEVNVSFDCVTDGGTIYGGAQNAHLESGVTLNITNGIYDDIYGGNNQSGTIKGPITINIRENGCMPIIIKGGVYAGGYKAGYSVYGYKTDNSARTKSEYEALADKDNIEIYRDPRINVISATKIGAIYGGGYQGLLVGNPHINVNMEKGRVLAEYANKAGDESKFTVDTHTTTDGETYTVESHDTGKDAILAIGTIGNIYGGGNDANVDGNTYVEIGTGQWLNNEGAYEREGTDGVTYTYKNGNWTYIDGAQEKVATTTPTPKRDKAFITGSVYGGGNLAGVTGNTNITFANGSVETAIYGGGNEGDVGTYEIEVNATTGSKTYNFTSGTGVCNVTINGGTVGPTEGDATTAKPGNVFGAGAGSSANFECDKAMADNANVTITGGTVKGNVYGGGMIARLEHDTNVTIGREGDNTSAPVVKGYVYGAGEGVATHGYSGLVRGNSTVTVQGKAKVESSIYGGGELATVGKYNVVDGIPDSPLSGGECTVTVRDYAEVGRNDMVMTAADGPDDWGHVFGAGKGVTPYKGVVGTPYSYKGDGEENKVVYTEEAKYLKYLETLALASNTKVTIGGHAFVKGSVYGGSENGIVQANTFVKIQDNCQIGNGYVQMDDNGQYLTTKVSVNRRYTDAEWAAGHLFVEGDPDIDATDATESALRTAVGTNYKTSLPECASWPYGENTGTPESPVMRYLAYDVYDYSAEKPVPKYASDGHTFYGNVFGGGSGYYPYRRKSGWVKDATKSAAVGQPVDKDGYSDGVWHRAAGAVYGNTTVEITGGHILSNVYGGNEMTDVGKFTNDVNGEPTIPNTAGLCTVKMSGGTLGVPRTLKQIAAHPVTCYLFGAGKGDQRINFNTWTNVNDAVVEVSNEARIYGSVFGGGEDGHVLGDTKVDIKTGKDVTVGTATTRYPYIGTTGTSYVDGNIFGGGRGFSGEALTAGSVGGNVSLNISDGTILGSVYGGGRLASVGTGFRAVTDPHYGQLQPDVADKTETEDVDETETHGHVVINISGGTIGNDLEDITVKHTKGGNVFGGSMGRLTLLDGSISPIWPKMAIVKSSKINISGNSLIKGNVYGGSELGMLRGDVYVTIGGVLGNDNTTIISTDSDNPTIMRDVYGGGYGSDDYKTKTTITAGGFTHDTYTFTPMQLAGIVCGDTYINMKRGHVKKNLYGGGEMATVGLVDFTHAEKHDDVTKSFALSWPYKMSFIPYDDSGASTAVGGATNINITGGRLGLTGKDFMGPFDADGNAISATDGHVLTSDEEKAARLDNGDVYGGGKGLAGDRYDYAFCANVKETHVTINYPANNGATPANYKDKSGNAYTHDCVAGAVYGGGENGHVIGDTDVKLTNGLIGHALYGGGSGKGKYTTSITRIDDETSKDVSIYSITAGKVYGNTNVEMTGGYVVRNIYGGGNMGSVGKGNYSGGADDYSTTGYGETITGNLWTTAFNSAAAESDTNPKDNAWHFLNSGKTSVKVTGGQVGYIDTDDPSESMKDDMVYGNVFGGCRGESAPNIGHSPRYEYSPEFFSGYINESDITIGQAAKGTVGEVGYVAASGPKILGSVYGGGQDGHVRRDTHVTVYGGEIGLPFSIANRELLKTENLGFEAELNNAQWLQRGNVYGAGSGIGKYEYDFNYNGVHYDNNGNLEKYDYTNPQNNKTSEMKEIDYSTSAGSVTRFTQVDILGGTIHRNVYGGGSQSSIGAPKIPVNGVMPADPDKKDLSESGIANQGKQSQCTVNIGGGTSKVTIGTEDDYKEHYGGEVYGASRGNPSLDATQFGTTIWTEVNVYENVKILGNVFGGGDAGMVKKDAKVTIGGNPVTP